MDNLHLLENIYAKHNNKVSIDDILERIQTGGNNLTAIHEARQYEKKSEEYEKIKLSKISCWLPNAVCTGYPFEDASLIAFTGLIYLDRDDLSKDQAIALKQELSQNKYVFAAWLSLSQTGIGALVRVSPAQLTKENFKNVYNNVANDVLGKYYDKRCRTITRKNVLSHDPDLFVNDNSELYAVDERNFTVKDTIPIKINSKVPVGDKLLFGNIFPKNQFEEGKDFIFEKEPYDNYQIWLPKTLDEDEGAIIKCIKAGQRHKTLNSILINMVAKNGIDNIDLLYNTLADINSRFCSPPETEIKLKKIFNNVIDLYSQEKLTSNYSRKSRMKWKEGNRLTSKEKQQITGQELGKFKKEQTKIKIETTFQQLMLDFSNQPTQKQVADKIALSERQIRKYWHNIQKRAVIVEKMF